MAGPAVVVSPPLSADLAPTVAAATYSANDAVGEQLTLDLPCPVASGPKGPIGIVQSFVMTCKDKIAPRLGLAIFSKPFTVIASGAAFAPIDADMENYVGMLFVETNHWLNFNANAQATRSAYGLAGKIIGGKWYCQFVAIDGLTTATADAFKGKIAGIIT